MSSPLRSLPAKVLLAVVVTAILVVVGVSRNTPTHRQPAADPLADRLGSVDTTTLTVRRAAFCSRLSTTTAAVALGTPASRAASGSRHVTTTTWKPGQSLQVNATVKDVVDEYGCSWATAAGAQARAWVFAPPVTPARAAKLAAQVPAGCQPLAPAAPDRTTARMTTGPATASPSPAAPALTYGNDTSALSCGGSTMLRGLFGDAWLSCELPSQDVDLVGRWCLAVARAAG